jgi:uncharacterized membrane protein
MGLGSRGHHPASTVRPLTARPPRAQRAFEERILRRLDEVDAAVQGARAESQRGLEDVAGLVRRMEAQDQQAGQYSRRIDDISEELKEGHRRLRAFEREVGPKSAETLSKVEQALGTLAGRLYDMEERQRAGFNETRQRLDGVDKTDTAVAALTSRLYDIEERQRAGSQTLVQRIEAVESMMALANAAPQAMAPALDLLVENMDWPGAEAIAKRLRASLPPGVVMADPEDMTPEEQQAAAGAAQKAQQQEAITMKDMELTLAQKELMLQKTLAEIEEIKAKAAANKAKAIRDVAEAKKADSETQAIEINTNLDIASYMDNSINPEEEQTE